MKPIVATVLGSVLIIAVIGAFLPDTTVSTESAVHASSPASLASTPARVPVAQASAVKPLRVAMAVWSGPMLPDMQAMLQDINVITHAEETADSEAMLRGCRAFKADVRTLRAHLPSPDPAMNAQLGGALDEFTEAADLCIAGVQALNVETRDESGTHLKFGAQKIRAVNALVAAY